MKFGVPLDGGHFYTCDGESLLRVTSALEAIGGKELIRWNAMMAAGCALELHGLGKAGTRRGYRQDRSFWNKDYIGQAGERYRDYKGEIGTMLHQAAEFRSYGTRLEPEQFPEHARNHIRGVHNFFDDWGPVPIVHGTEAHVIHRAYRCPLCGEIHKYAGKFDGGFEFPLLGKRYLVDFKGSNQLWWKQVYQMNAYGFAEGIVLEQSGQILPMPNFDGAMIVWIRPDTKRGYRLIPVPLSTRLFASFGAALHLAYAMAELYEPKEIYPVKPKAERTRRTPAWAKAGAA